MAERETATDSDQQEIKREFFDSHGIVMRSVSGTNEYRNLKIKGKRIQFIDDEYTKVVFTPYGSKTTENKDKTKFNPKKTTATLVDAVEGLINLDKEIQSGKLILPQVCIGETNPRMFLIARRVGFQITDESKQIIEDFLAQEVVVDRPQWAGKVIVVANLDQILEVVRKYKSTGKVPNRPGKDQTVTLGELIARKSRNH